MRLSTVELVNLINLLLNSLEHSKRLILEACYQKERLGANDDFVTEMAGGVIGMAIAQAFTLNALIARSESLRPNEEGLELIEFWMSAREATGEAEANAN